MPSVVFMRAVNVGGNKVFQPSLLARELAHLDVVNVGAAGTFVVRQRIGAAALRAVLLRSTPVAVELMICRGSEVTALVAKDPFPPGQPTDVRRLVTIMARRPRQRPPLPLSFPPGDQWELKVLEVSGPFAFCLWRRLGKSFVDPSTVVQKHFGVRGTTRNWNTICKLAAILEAGAGQKSAARPRIRR